MATYDVESNIGLALLLVGVRGGQCSLRALQFRGEVAARRVELRRERLRLPLGLLQIVLQRFRERQTFGNFELLNGEGTLHEVGNMTQSVPLHTLIITRGQITKHPRAGIKSETQTTSHLM